MKKMGLYLHFAIVLFALGMLTIPALDMDAQVNEKKLIDEHICNAGLEEKNNIEKRVAIQLDDKQKLDECCELL